MRRPVSFAVACLLLAGVIGGIWWNRQATRGRDRLSATTVSKEALVKPAGDTVGSSPRSDANALVETSPEMIDETIPAHLGPSDSALREERFPQPSEPASTNGTSEDDVRATVPLLAPPARRNDPLRSADVSEQPGDSKSGALSEPMTAHGAESRSHSSRRKPIPPFDRQAKARELVRSIFAERTTRSSRDSQAVATRKMLSQAWKTHEDPIARYVLFSEVRKEAANVGDLSTAWSALEALEAEYEVASGELAGDTISRLNRRIRTRDDVHVLFGRARKFLDMMLNELQFDQALRMAPEMLTIARRTEEPEIVAVFSDLDRQIAAARDAYEDVRPTWDRLREAPEDEQGNDEVGRFLAFVVGDVDSALPYLAKSSDPDNAALGQATLGSEKADARTVAQWWQRGVGLEGYVGVRVREFAASLYRSVSSQVSASRGEDELERPAGDRILDALERSAGQRLDREIAAFETLYARRVPLIEVLSASTWTVRWSSGSTWRHVEFKPDGNCRMTFASGNGSMKWEAVDFSRVLLHPGGGDATFVVERNGSQLAWSKRHNQTRQPLLSGMGIPE